MSVAPARCAEDTPGGAPGGGIIGGDPAGGAAPGGAAGVGQ